MFLLGGSSSTRGIAVLSCFDQPQVSFHDWRLVQQGNFYELGWSSSQGQQFIIIILLLLYCLYYCVLPSRSALMRVCASLSIADFSSPEKGKKGKGLASSTHSSH